MSPGVKVDPLSMLAEAKRVCDTLVRAVFHYVMELKLMIAIPVGKSIPAWN